MIIASMSCCYRVFLACGMTSFDIRLTIVTVNDSMSLHSTLHFAFCVQYFVAMKLFVVALLVACVYAQAPTCNNYCTTFFQSTPTTPEFVKIWILLRHSRNLHTSTRQSTMKRKRVHFFTNSSMINGFLFFFSVQTTQCNVFQIVMAQLPFNIIEAFRTVSAYALSSPLDKITARLQETRLDVVPITPVLLLWMLLFTVLTPLLLEELCVEHTVKLIALWVSPNVLLPTVTLWW